MDAPPIVYGYAALGVAGVVLVVVDAAVTASSVLLGWGLWALVVGFGVAGLMLYSSKVGKVRVRDRLLDSLKLCGDEDVLDLGCGSGLMLIGAATQTPAGTATGIDLWRTRDQAGSTRVQCLTNARRVGVHDRVRLIDGDMTDLPLPDSSIDVVLACLAIHNLHPAARREKAVREAARVLRPGGRLAFIDIAGTRSYVSSAADAGLRDPRRSGYVLGIFPPARIVTARGPAQSQASVTAPP
ncbi:MAG: class I SAM-dependent methyltransferase [Acidimicrobiales bacterium]